jgi:capsular exopolysaccharide synthesis family protein
LGEDHQQERPAADLRHYLSLVWRRKWILLPIVVVIPLATYLISKGLSKTYEASTIVQVKDTEGSASLFSNSVDFGGSGAAEAARLIPTTVVGREAAKELGLPPDQGGSLAGQVSAHVDDGEAGFITITSRGDNAKQTAAVANAFAVAIGAKRAADATEDIDQTISNLSQQADEGDAHARAALAEQLQQLRALRASQNDATLVIEPAAAPGAPISPNPRRNATVAFVLALLLAAGVVPLLEGLDRRMRDPEDLEGIVEAPLLGMIPEDAFPGHAPGAHVREAFQTLRAGFTYFNVDSPLTSVVIASPGHGDGKTTVATNLAMALAQDDRNVILVDGDLRKPQVAKRLGIEQDVHFGIDAVLVQNEDLDDALVDVDVGAGRLRVLPGAAPPPNPSVLLGSQRMRAVLAELSERAEILIIDSPPILTVSDAIPLMQRVSGTVLVARMGYTSREALRKARQVITTARGTVLGVVATGTKVGGLYGYDGYGYGYGPVEEPLPGAQQNGAPPKRRGLLRRRIREEQGSVTLTARPGVAPSSEPKGQPTEEFTPPGARPAKDRARRKAAAQRDATRRGGPVPPQGQVRRPPQSPQGRQTPPGEGQPRQPPRDES